jgi:non-specific serine/threonine protein kinase
MTSSSPIRYRFGAFELQPEERRLLSGGTSVAISPRAFDLLVVLVESEGRLSTKDELLERVWPRMVVEENALQAQISLLRKILGAEAIATVARSGYRFTLDVTRAMPQPAAGSGTKDKLPQPLTTFIGREKEIAQLGVLLGRTRLLTLTGAGGCGKTRLAIQVARSLLEAYPDGVWFVEFASLADPSLVPRAVAAALGLQERPGEPLTRTIAQRLSATRPLLVLDNAEHLAEAVAALVDELLVQCANAVFLVTSRQPLGVVGETSRRVPSLSVPDLKHDTTPQQLAAYESVQLLVDRARMQRPHFALTADNAVALASICQRLDGIPLAIELAAPRLRSMSVEEVNRRLDQRFCLLNTGPRTALHRQRTLRAMIDWSYDLLSPAEQALLCRASVFAGGWTLEAAEQVCVAEGEDPASMLDLLGALTDKNLVQTEEHDGDIRYRMLETVRQYATERLDDAGAGAVWRARHFNCHLQLAQSTAGLLLGGDPGPVLDRLETEHDNLRAAWAWSAGAAGDALGALRLAVALGRFWLKRGHHNEAIAVTEQAIEATRRLGATKERAAALQVAATFLLMRSALERAHVLLEECLAIRRELNDLEGIANTLWLSGTLASQRADYAAARAHFEESLALHEQLGMADRIPDDLSNLGSLAAGLGDYASARALHERSLALRREKGDRWGTGAALYHLSSVHIAVGEYALAGACIDESLAIVRELGDPRLIANCTVNQGTLANLQGDVVSAAALFKDCLPTMVTLGNPEGIGDALAGLAVAYAATDATRAARLWGAMQQLMQSTGVALMPEEQRRDQRDIAAARAAFGDDAAFDRAWHEGRAMSLEQAVRYALADETAQVAQTAA